MIQTLDYYRVAKILDYLDKNYTKQPSLAELGKIVNLSPTHFQKVFTTFVGVSPKKFLQALTIEHAKKVLLETQSSFETTLQLGLSSTSRLHELFVKVTSVTPKEYKTLGKNIIIYYEFYTSYFGRCLIAVTDKGLTNLFFVDKSENDSLMELQKNWKNAKLFRDKNKTKNYFDAIFNSHKGDLQLFLKGTPFQIQVWTALLKIPQGKLISYKSLAHALGSQAFRAVGNAVGANPVSYLIPCHRVINEIGIIGNYRWGKERKKFMLGRELV